jgi:RNA polymerase sigma-70 factor, ECF subfamily
LKQTKLFERLNRKVLFGWRTSPFITADAFSNLYETTYSSIYRFVYGLTGGPVDLVEDLTGETYLRAWKYRDSYHGESQAAVGWLITIARNLMIDASRQGQLRLEDQAGPLDDELMPIQAASPEDCCVMSEEQQILLWLMQQIPSEPREMLVLRYLLGWKVNQIAGHLEIPENTVSVTIRRSLLRLQQIWPEEKE